MRPLPGPLVSSRSSSMRPPMSFKSETPKAFAIRFFEPKALMRSGWSLPWTSWKRRAGPVRFMTRSEISVISNFALTGSRTSTSSPPRRSSFTNSCRLLAGTRHLLYRSPDAPLRTLFALTGDYAQELGQVRCPEPCGDRTSAGDLAGAIPNHAASHTDEARFVQSRYRLDRPSVSVIPNEDRVVGRHSGRVVRPEPLLQISQSLGDDPASMISRTWQTPSGVRKHLPERDLRRTAYGLH